MVGKPRGGVVRFSLSLAGYLFTSGLGNAGTLDSRESRSQSTQIQLLVAMMIICSFSVASDANIKV